MRLVFVILGLCLAQPVVAQDVQAVAQAADALFPDMPDLQIVPQIAGNCGADTEVNASAAYCTSTNRILVADGGLADARTAYLVAHGFGHAVQVRHGVADVALQEITRRPDDEAMLRGWVERQVDCIAGAVLAQAGGPLPDLAALFADDPLDQPHWGRNPLSRGPHLPVPLQERQMWLATGYDSGVAACAVGEFGADLLVAALRR